MVDSAVKQGERKVSKSDCWKSGFYTKSNSIFKTKQKIYLSTEFSKLRDLN
jgi:hypothetical protein